VTAPTDLCSVLAMMKKPDGLNEGRRVFRDVTRLAEFIERPQSEFQIGADKPDVTAIP